MYIVTIIKHLSVACYIKVKVVVAGSRETIVVMNTVIVQIAFHCLGSSEHRSINKIMEVSTGEKIKRRKRFLSTKAVICKRSRKMFSRPEKIIGNGKRLLPSQLCSHLLNWQYVDYNPNKIYLTFKFIIFLNALILN